MSALALSRKRLGLAAVVLIVAALGLACGGNHESSNAGTSTSRTDVTAPDGADRTAPDKARNGDSGSTSGEGTSRGPAADGGTGGAGAPRADDVRRRRSLARYLASRYMQSPWYPLLRTLRVTGTHVTVRLRFDPNSDDEVPPQLACTAVRSYGREVQSVTVYGSPTSQGRTAILKRC